MQARWQTLRQLTKNGISRQEGKIGYILAWALGVPIPVLLLVYVLRGCS